MVRRTRQSHGRGRGRNRYRQSRPRRIPSLLRQSHSHRRHRHRIADSDSGSRPSRGCFLSLSVLEELNRPLVLLRGASGLERTEVPPPATFGVDLSRVEAILARFQLPNHAYLLSITGRAARAYSHGNSNWNEFYTWTGRIIRPRCTRSVWTRREAPSRRRTKRSCPFRPPQSMSPPTR